jgi:Carboxypeptidase regulatory-like domain
MKKTSRGLPLLAAAVVMLLWSFATYGQSFYGAITGTATDQSGATMPAVKVTLTNLGTGDQRSVDTDAAGLYRFPDLVPGRYKIDAEKAGFKHFTREPIVLNVQTTLSIDLAMEVGAVTQSVQVTAQTPLLQPETSSLGQVVQYRQVTEMPLNGRNPLNLVELVPGVVMQGSAQGNPAGKNPFAAGNIQIGGGMANQSVEFWDGAPLNNGNASGLVMVPTQDSLQEFKVQTNNLSSEFGRFAGGVVNFATKSGTKEFHGDLYEYLRNKVLNSNTFFNNAHPGTAIPTPPYVQNQFGGSLGGPMVIPGLVPHKGKLFFFTNLERYTQRTSISGLLSVPTAAEANGDFSNVRDAKGNVIPIYDPTTTRPDPANPGHYLRDPFLGNIIPANRLDPAAKYLGAAVHEYQQLEWQRSQRL